MASRLVVLYTDEHDMMPDPKHALQAADYLVTKAGVNGRLAAVTEEDEVAAFPPRAAPPPMPSDKPPAQFNDQLVGERELRDLLGKRDDVSRRNGFLVWVRKVTTTGTWLRDFDKPSSFAIWADDHFYIHVVEEEEGRTSTMEIPLPSSVAQRIITAEVWTGVDVVLSVSRIPVVRRDGSLRVENGYDAATKVWFDIDEDLADLDVPEVPTPADVEKQLGVLLDVLSGFPWVDKRADHANAFGLLLTPHLLPLINSVVPIHAVTAPGDAQGTGKSVLGIELPALMAGGHTAITFTPDAEELRKTLTTSLLRSSARVLSMDNIATKDVFESAVLAAAVTSGRHEDRQLGSNTMVASRRPHPGGEWQ